MTNCLFLRLLERSLKLLPQQELGIYLLENIGWEMAFVHAWKAAGHGTLVGVPHSTVRYWDLRYFYDPRSYARTGRNDLPLPDLVAINGPPAAAAYRDGGFPEDRLIEVEALRYLHLEKLGVGPRAARGAGAPLRVLILGDYMPHATSHQMRMLAAATSMLPPETRYIVKPHPSCPIRQHDYPSMQLEITGEPMALLLASCDVAYTSNMTSAAVDAYSAGVGVVSVLDPASLNISPLRGLASVTYVTSPSELARALSAARREKDDSPRRPYFCLDRQLPRWRRLLGLPVSAA
jgi:surface carbohydrate biosynthesis protein (TIGR04326 family)